MPFVSTFLLDSLRLYNEGHYECYQLLCGEDYYDGPVLGWVTDALPKLTDEGYQEITSSLIGKDKREKQQQKEVIGAEDKENVVEFGEEKEQRQKA